MQLPGISPATTSSGPPVTAADETAAASGFETLLASLMTAAPDAVQSPETLLPAADPAAMASPAGEATTAANAELAVSMLLASLPDARMPMLPGTSTTLSAAAAASAATDQATLPATAAAPLTSPAFGAGFNPKAGAPANVLPARAGADVGHDAARRPLPEPAGKEPDALNAADTGAHPALSGGNEHELRTAPLPAIAAAEPRPAPGIDTLPRQPQAVLPVTPPLTEAGWKQSFSEQVLWVARAELQSASLTLNPPALGPVSIELQLNDAQAAASFSSAVPEVRKAIEDALPGLKALFAEAGLDLRQADVGSGDTHSGHARPEHPQGEPGHPRTAADESEDRPRTQDMPPTVRAARGLLDTFA